MRQYGGFRKPRTKKIRSAVRVKERVAKKGGRCSGCRGRYEAGDPVTVVNIRRRTYHRLTCVPANAGQLPTATPGGPVIANTPTAVVSALSANWTTGEAKLVAIMALENAMVVVGKNAPAFTEAMERSFRRFMAAKEHLLRPGSDTEAASALKLGIIETVKTFF